jgi:hypothetical protein
MEAKARYKFLDGVSAVPFIATCSMKPPNVGERRKMISILLGMNQTDREDHLSTFPMLSLYYRAPINF